MFTLRAIQAEALRMLPMWPGDWETIPQGTRERLVQDGLARQASFITMVWRTRLGDAALQIYGQDLELARLYVRNLGRALVSACLTDRLRDRAGALFAGGSPGSVPPPTLRYLGSMDRGYLVCVPGSSPELFLDGGRALARLRALTGEHAGPDSADGVPR